MHESLDAVQRGLERFQIAEVGHGCFRQTGRWDAVETANRMASFQ